MFGHVLILAGSKRMLGASALCGLAAMRSGAGLTTLGVPESLNIPLQKKISPVIMTLPLPETKEQSLSYRAWNELKKSINTFNVIALGPGLTQHSDTKKFIHAVIKNSTIPLVIDADGLNVLEGKTNLLESRIPKILTPHAGEFKRLFGLQTAENKVSLSERKRIAKDIAAKFQCVIVLKGHETVVTDGFRVYVNKTGNAGMATAGCGDVLTGMISALTAQKLSPFDAARFGVYLHGLAGDLAAASVGKTALIATDIVDYIPNAFKKTKSEKGKGRSEKPQPKT